MAITPISFDCSSPITSCADLQSKVGDPINQTLVQITSAETNVVNAKNTATTQADRAKQEADRAEELANADTTTMPNNLFEEKVLPVSTMPGTPIRYNSESTDNAWGCGVGTREKFNTITIKAKAVDNTNLPTKLRIRVKEDSYNGVVLGESTIDFPISDDVEVNFVLHNTIDTSALLWVELIADAPIAYENDPYDNTYEASQGLTKNFRGTSLEDTPINDFNNDAMWMKFGVYEGKTILSEDGLSYFKEQLVPQEIPNINLPERLYGTVNKPLQLFDKGIIVDYMVNRYNKNTDTDGTTSRNYDRYYEIEENSERTRAMRFWLEDINGNNMIEKSTTIEFRNPPSNPTTTKNLLCIGDSITHYSRWTDELRLLLDTQTNINFIGTMVGADGHGGTTPNEGYSGATYKDFAEGLEVQGRQTPFYTQGHLSFQDYMVDNGFTGDIDYVVIMLGWNDQENYTANWDTDLIPYAKILLDKLKLDYPNVQVKLLGINPPFSGNGGTAYDDNVSRSNYFKALKTVHKLSEELRKMIVENSYSDWVEFLDVASQFDSDYGYQLEEKQVNSRCSIMEKVSPKFIHPNEVGDNMIADIIYNGFWRVL